MDTSEEKLHQIDICQSTDRLVSFKLWVKTDEAMDLWRTVFDEDDEVKGAIRIEKFNYNLVVILERYLGNLCKLRWWISWEPVGRDCPEASDRERIANFISELPNLSFIEEFKTIDQVNRWVEWKSNCIWTAKCLLAGRGSPENPLLRPLEEGEIDQYYHDMCWLTVDLYENLWKLISLKTRRIRASFNKQGWALDSPRQLLEEIIASSINGEFSNILKHHYEGNAKELTKIAKLGHCGYVKRFLPQKDTEELIRLKKKHSPPNIWLERLIDVSHLLAEKDEFIRVRVAIHDEIMKGVCNLEINAGCQPELRQHGQVSEIWKNGVRKVGMNNGWRP